MHTANTGATRNSIFTWKYLELLISKEHTSFSANMNYTFALGLKRVLIIFSM
jgi:DUF971 family protein